MTPVPSLADKVQFTSSRRQRVAESLEQKRKELVSLGEVQKQHQPLVEKVRQQGLELSKEQAAVKSRLLSRGKELYAELSAKLGIADVGRALHEQQQLRARWAEREISYLETIAKLDAEMEILKRGQTKKLEQDIKSCQELLQEAQERRDQLDVEMRRLDGLAQTSLQLQVEKVTSDQEAETNYRRLKDEVGQIRQAQQQTTQQKGSDAARRSAIKLERLDIFRTSVYQDVPLPVEVTDAGSEPPATPTQTQTPSSPRQTQASSPGQTQASLEALDRGGSVVVDYSSLPGVKAISQDASGESLRRKIEEQERCCEKLEADLAQMRPNLKSLERYDDVAGRVQQTNVEADDARKKTAELEKEFGEVRQKRQDAFMQCFNHLQGKIDSVYRELTTYSDEADGGSAYLDLENEDEPYLRGVTFTTRVPSKRYRELEHQSGGERTVAALALLFALHSYAAPPFLILDEVDAALDAQNVDALVRFLQRAEFQAIVISLKDKLYSESDALVGVFKPMSQNSSKVLTLDLQQYA